MVDKQIAILMFKNGHSYSEIGRELGVSRQRIHQILTGYRTLTYLRKYKPKHKRQKNSMVNKIEHLLERGCAICRSQAKNIHHIDRDSQNNDMKNLMPVCVSCHKELHWGEKAKKISKLKIKPNWKRKYKECVICRSTKRMYGGMGLCYLCYQIWRNQKIRDEERNNS